MKPLGYPAPYWIQEMVDTFRMVGVGEDGNTKYSYKQNTGQQTRMKNMIAFFLKIGPWYSYCVYEDTPATIVLYLSADLFIFHTNPAQVCPLAGVRVGFANSVTAIGLRWAEPVTRIARSLQAGNQRFALRHWRPEDVWSEPSHRQRWLHVPLPSPSLHLQIHTHNQRPPGAERQWAGSSDLPARWRK